MKNTLLTLFFGGFMLLFGIHPTKNQGSCVAEECAPATTQHI